MKVQEIYLAGVRNGRATHARVEKALRATENDAEVRRMLEEQQELDSRVIDLIQVIEPPEDLRRRLTARMAECQTVAKKKSHETMAAIAAVALGLAVIAGLFVWLEVEHSRKFPGRDAMLRMLEGANRMTGVELEPITNSAGQLEDWFYMRGFESYRPPGEVSGAKAVGLRLYRQDGHMVAQVALDLHDSLMYVFRADDFGVALPDTGWRLLDNGGWVAAARQNGPVCTMITFRGNADEMEQVLQSLSK